MPDYDEDSNFNPKHRIVGAIVLVVLAIILVPMILREEQLDGQKTGERLIVSDKEAKVYVSKAKDLRQPATSVKAEKAKLSVDTKKQPAEQYQMKSKQNLDNGNYFVVDVSLSAVPQWPVKSKSNPMKPSP